jgi:hypothetical protein
MPWVKLTDDWYDDPKIAALDDHGIALWVIGITWCARNLTDGHIPAGAVRRLVADPDRAVDQLVAARVWSSTEEGFLVENYLQYQPSRDEVLSKRSREKARSQRRRTTPDQPPRGDRAVDQAETSPRPSHPVPVPVVDTSSQRYSRRSPQPSARVPLSESEHPVVVAQRLREQGSVVPVASQDAHQVEAS